MTGERDEFDEVVLDEQFIRGGVHEPPARTREAIATLGDQTTSWRHAGPLPPGPPPSRPGRGWLERRFPPSGRQSGISPIFLALVGFTAVIGWLLWSGSLGRYGTFLFVVSGWLVSLCLHEFSHALVGYHGGDDSVATKGYLRLDIRRYQHPLMSYVLPVVFVLMGGIGLPGGAVWINRSAIRRRWVRSATSYAGPLANAVCTLLCFAPFEFGALRVTPGAAHYEFAAALAFLGLLQATAVLLNLLPLPGLDGWGALEPYMPESVVAFGRQIGFYSFLILFFLLFRMPAFNHAFFSVVWHASNLMHVPSYLAGEGYRAMHFWSQT